MPRHGYSVKKQGGPQINAKYIATYIHRRNEVVLPEESTSDNSEDTVGQAESDSTDSSDNTDVLRYDEETDTYLTSPSRLGKAIEELGVMLGAVLVLHEDFLPSARRRIYKCYFANHKLSAGATRKLHREMLTRAAIYERDSSAVPEGRVSQNSSATDWRSATAGDLATGHNDQWLREPRHMTSRLNVHCKVMVRVELPFRSEGNVRIKVVHKDHSHPVGDYVNEPTGCKRQSVARGRTGNLCLPVRSVLKKAFSLYRQANNAASYGEVARLSFTR